MFRAFAALLYISAVYVHVEARRKMALSAKGMTELVGRLKLGAPDYESRPGEHGQGACGRYTDVLPGEPLNSSSHTIVMTLQFQFWQCHDYNYSNGENDDWCKSAGVQGEWEYQLFGLPSPCGGCWCCKRQAEEEELQAAQEAAIMAEKDQAASFVQQRAEHETGWQCYTYNYSNGENDDWCESAGIQGEWEYYYNSQESLCGGCWCCRRQTSAPTGPSLVGCYADDLFRMFDRGPHNYGYTGESCAFTCSIIGDAYFGLQDGGWCSCGSQADIGSYERMLDSECGPEEENYGGYRGGRPFRNAVYEVQLPPADQPEGWVGCFVDDADRMFDRGPNQYGFTGETCEEWCRSIAESYFGLQAGGFCTCGSDDDFDRRCDGEIMDERAPDEECGPEEEAYGGYRGGRRWRNAVYKVNPGVVKTIKRQWIFNIGQSRAGAEHWLWNLHQGPLNKIQFGAWNGRQIDRAGIYGVRTIATTYDGDTQAYKLYLNGNLVASLNNVSLNIKTGDMTIGQVTTRYINRESDFLGCVRGVDVYRGLLTDAEVADAGTRLVNAVG